MGLGIIILLRVLFAASMVFIIGYVFGGFSKKPALRTITKVASILVIVLFIAANVLLTRMAVRQWNNGNNDPWCKHGREVKTEIPRP
ncbi:hypothetical protein MRBLMN1_002921 [Chitinophaga ginsengisegetis]|uniref:hypothetical protein n=1 Tax=Chitinophaga ginsengisegetis TaxID=393003 RepID=UPI000DB9FB83|nr:hypothetical protein [Chitinophaga ginsengisegetis]MDR6568598.1 hypothetical protein [Chitinophaga ginsengisegetis]MDR6648171.1 hypothetical protein [Chitinophaga ginsengisegetis]MDR6654679.1 hypothetical protein [Chitinophaga ginsengisegetis]